MSYCGMESTNYEINRNQEKGKAICVLGLMLRR